jgi:hypothetical protein
VGDSETAGGVGGAVGSRLNTWRPPRRVMRDPSHIRAAPVDIGGHSKMDTFSESMHLLFHQPSLL